jgi:hypothetical protein
MIAKYGAMKQQKYLSPVNRKLTEPSRPSAPDSLGFPRGEKNLSAPVHRHDGSRGTRLELWSSKSVGALAPFHFVSRPAPAE